MVQSGCLTQNCCEAKGRPVASRIRNEMDGVRLGSGSWRPDSYLRRFSKSRAVDCVINMGITVEDVRFPMGLRQAVIIQTR